MRGFLRDLNVLPKSIYFSDCSYLFKDWNVSLELYQYSRIKTISANMYDTVSAWNSITLDNFKNMYNLKFTLPPNHIFFKRLELFWKLVDEGAIKV